MLYLEDMILLNYAVDLSLMALTGRILGERARMGGYLLAALLMSTAGCMVFLPIVVNRLALSIAMTMGAAALAWRIRTLRQALRNWAALFAVSALAGGMAYFFALGSAAHPLLGALPISPAYLAAAAVCIAACAGSVAFGKITTRSLRRWICRVRIVLGGECIEVEALVDTGNQLTEPLSGMPVILLGREQKKLLSDRNVVHIFCQTAMGRGSLPAVLPDSVEIYRDGKWQRASNAFAAVSDREQFAGENALVPACILES